MSADISDIATERETQAREHAIEAQRRRCGLAGKTTADSLSACSVCDEPIPEARRNAVPGVQTCVDCQHDLERALHATSLRRGLRR